MGKQRGNYSEADRDAAVLQVLAGAEMKATSKKTNIPFSTLKKYVAAARKGTTIQPKRRGPKPLLPQEAEATIRDWVLARQKSGHPVSRHDVLDKAQQIAQLISGLTVGKGWLRRFLQRNPSLTLRWSQSVSKVRNEVEESDLSVLFASLAKVIIEHNMGASRIFNVDETAIETTREHRQVLAAKGSQNVWHKDVKTSFHLSFVACGSASGFMVPPLFIFPGESVNDDVFETCQLPGAGVTTTEKAFMTATLFARWLRFFAEAVPTPIQRPLLLVMDGCASHISVPIVEEAERFGVILVCLPPNGTHLLQPLDVAVFSSFKNSLKMLVDILLPSIGDANIDKQTALGLAALAWNELRLGSNMSAGFRSCGIYPLSRVNMHAKLANFEQNGLPASYRDAAWVQVSETVRREILILPARANKTRKRQRKKTGGRILTRQLLEEEALNKRTKSNQGGRALKRKQTAPPPVFEVWV